jgi:hypothetical protein
MTEQPQMCLGCNQRPAVPNSGKTVPLCAECAALAAGKGRGVEFQKDKSDGTSTNMESGDAT